VPMRRIPLDRFLQDLDIGQVTQIDR
jgi:hypothetical protein